MFKLLGSYLVTTVCSWTIAFLIPLYIYDITHSALWTSLAYFAAMAPYILVTPFAGVWSDRYSKRKFLIWGDVINAVVGFLMYVTTNALSGITLACVLLFLGFLIASVGATHHPVFQSIAPAILPSETLHRFNSAVNATDNIVRITAPIAVATMLTFTSKTNILITGTVCFLISIPICISLPEVQPGNKIRNGVFRELGIGFRYVFNNRNLISFSALFMCVNFGLALVGADLTYIFLSILKVPTSGLGYYYGIIGIGAVSGSFVASFLVSRLKPGAMIVGSCFLAGVFSLVGGFATTPLAVSLLWALSTAFQSMVVVAFFTFRQQVVPKEILGRTIGITRLISYLAIPPATVLGGWLLDQYRSSLIIMAAGGVVIIFASFLALSLFVLRPQPATGHMPIQGQ
ncbi:MFS transporter [Burkholderia ubonensis]|uniref:MFS transporter n=1 Tax=Burkholderia ubonensis TaxID=101571 RepID=A0AB74D2L0_9BURK|nr:MFS transporter [Burkholderia ubonensis]PAK00798.1 MFS transporter [Burkholderia ubonensis]PAK12510.1 MFS transporter [Burkholderia ubonensis]RQP69139.1 MFS transporter [Burkholderia ubonensis]RQP85541.1 MFS transporter [Burkholderia ubonensis]